MTVHERLLEDWYDEPEDPRDRWNEDGDEDIDCPVCGRPTEISELANFGRCSDCAEREAS